MSITAITFTFLSMGAFAFLMWTLVQKQEKNDFKFEEKLAADDRRAKANRQAAGMESGAAIGQAEAAPKQVQRQSPQEPPKPAP
ncbi:MAG: hypothetical protein EXS12_00435 [Phycisphaerales bacterium]|nr:hypothetical protein [Phycisphaerales bacterium]